MIKEEAKQKVAELVKKYEGLSPRELNQYSHNEEATKLNFIMPLFTALGWDFQSNNEVTAEEKASNGRVDYAFKLKNVTQLCLEAKPLKSDINSENYKKQAIDYAYYKAVTWAALTNFEELRLFNAQKKDNFITLTHDKYIQEFDDLWLLSKESFETGLLKAKATKYGVLSPPPRIETLLYTDLREWRGQLYNQLHQHNASLKSYEIDEVIQKFFNRLIFIRTCEDKGLEGNQLLETVREWEKGGHKGELVEKVKQIFQNYNQWYDSELFDTHLLDSDKVFIEGSTVENIVKGMANYAFDLIDADVLGAVYEQYLGFVAAEAKEKPQEQQQMALGLSGDATFTIVNKKQHRKEQGIYYTPRFVTDYIVKETVGRFIKEHNANEIFNIKILDPACGSGSFLIRAYDELLTYYAADQQKTVAHLNQNDRLPVLKRNIFGVDLDRQAVEIARLNLLIRSLAGREILPGLKDNIKQGNSLISGTPEKLEKYFGKTYENKRPFDWKNQFSEIADNGGFDIVIGNPPYVRIQSLPRDEADFYRDIYDSAFGSFDIYVLFIEQAIKLLKSGGHLGFITSGKFLRSDYGKKIQQLILEKCTVENIVDLSAQQIFNEATTYPVIIVLQKGTSEKPLQYNFVPENIELSGSSQPLESLSSIYTSQAAITKGTWPPAGSNESLFGKLSQNTAPLREVAKRIFVGLQTSADKIFVLKKLGELKDGKVKVYSSSLNQELELESEMLKPFLTGKNITRYYSPPSKELLLFPYKLSGGKATLISQSQLQTLYPNVWVYLCLNQNALEQREYGRFQGSNWYAFGRNQNLAIHGQRKLAIPSTVKRLMACYDYAGEMYLDNVRVNGILLKEESDIDYKYITGLLNSKLLHWFFSRVATPFANGWFGANRQFIETLPIRTVAFSNSTEKKLHNEIVSQVDKMLDLNKKLTPIRGTYSFERDDLIKEIENTDKKIDNLVYDLYGLTAEEIKIVEEEIK